MEKKDLNANQTKAMFVQSIHNWLMKTLTENHYEEYKECFKIDGSSIICSLPDKYFDMYNIPHNTKIEMKFITKKF